MNQYIKELSRVITRCFKQGGKLLIFGCGGLASESNHFAAEMVGKYMYDRVPLPAISLTSNEAIITAISNDFSFDHVFERQIKALGKPGDVAIGMSTSGRSPSVIKGLATAREMGLAVIDWPRSGVETPEIQENQIKLIHQVCKEVEKAVCFLS